MKPSFCATAGGSSGDVEKSVVGQNTCEEFLSISLKVNFFATSLVGVFLKLVPLRKKGVEIPLHSRIPLRFSYSQ